MLTLKRELGGLTSTVSLALLISLLAPTKTQARTANSPSPLQELSGQQLLLAYKYAFHMYARQNALAAAREYKGESGAEMRDSLRLRFNLTVQEFVPFHDAALDNQHAEILAEDRINAIAEADRAQHPKTNKLSPEAKAKVHGVFAEVIKEESQAVNSIHEALDAPIAQKMDGAVASLLADARGNTPPAPRRRLGLKMGLPGLTFGANSAVGEDLAAVTPMYANPGNCVDIPPDEEQDDIDACDENGGTYDLEDCACSGEGGDGGGGGGGDPPSPTVTISIAFTGPKSAGDNLSFGAASPPDCTETLGPHSCPSIWLWNIEGKGVVTDDASKWTVTQTKTLAFKGYYKNSSGTLVSFTSNGPIGPAPDPMVLQQPAGQTAIYFIDGPGGVNTDTVGGTAYPVDSLTLVQNFTTTFCSTSTDDCTPINWYEKIVVDPGATLDLTQSIAATGTASTTF
jgi:hypothetical protein